MSAARGRRPGLTKLGFNFMIFILIFVETFSVWLRTGIQRIVIGFEVILEIQLQHSKFGRLYVVISFLLEMVNTGCLVNVNATRQRKYLTYYFSSKSNRVLPLSFIFISIFLFPLSFYLSLFVSLSLFSLFLSILR